MMTNHPLYVLMFVGMGTGRRTRGDGGQRLLAAAVAVGVVAACVSWGWHAHRAHQEGGKDALALGAFLAGARTRGSGSRFPARGAAHPVVHMDTVLHSARERDELVHIIEDWERYALYFAPSVDHHSNADFGEAVPPAADGSCPRGMLRNHDATKCQLASRFDIGANYGFSGGRKGRNEPVSVLSARSNYFRETFVYADAAGRSSGSGGGNGSLPHAEERAETKNAATVKRLSQLLLHNPDLITAAKQLYFPDSAEARAQAIVEPTIVFANILLPGQQLALHTDVPAFRGVTRQNAPEWLCAVIHHNNANPEWYQKHRVRIATGVMWYAGAPPNPDVNVGGEFVYFPHGVDGGVEKIAPNDNTAAMLDTDSCWHAVDPVMPDSDRPLPPIERTWTLRFHKPSQLWHLESENGTLQATYHWSELRLSVSWKAYVFENDAERQTFLDHSDDLDIDTVVNELVTDLKQRGALPASPADPSRLELARTLTSTYVRFPPSERPWWSPLNYCILPYVLPALEPYLSVLGC